MLRAVVWNAKCCVAMSCKGCPMRRSLSFLEKNLLTDKDIDPLVSARCAVSPVPEQSRRYSAGYGGPRP